MSGAQGQGGSAPQAAQGSQDLAPMQMLQSYKSAPDRAAWMQQNQTQAQPVQPWQPPQRMYAHQQQPAQVAPVQQAPMMARPTYQPGESLPAFAFQRRAYDRQQNGQGAK